MSQLLKRTLYWSPRILGILLAAFISIFALDVFGEGYSFWKTILALSMHLIPTAVLVIVLVVSWRWEWAGGIFIALGLFYILTMRGFPFSVYLLISGPAFLIGILFLLNWRYKGVIRSKD
jgi:hypothetical protein